MTNFDKTLLNQAKYWPTLYRCRANILNQLFATVAGGFSWEDGRRSDGLRTRKQREAHFAQVEAANKRDAECHTERLRGHPATAVAGEDRDKGQRSSRRLERTSQYKPVKPLATNKALDEECVGTRAKIRALQSAKRHTRLAMYALHTAETGLIDTEQSILKATTLDETVGTPNGAPTTSTAAGRGTGPALEID